MTIETGKTLREEGRRRWRRPIKLLGIALAAVVLFMVYNAATGPSAAIRELADSQYRGCMIMHSSRPNYQAACECVRNTFLNNVTEQEARDRNPYRVSLDFLPHERCWRR